MLDEFVKVFDDYTKKGRIQELKTLAREHSIPIKSKAGYGGRPTAIKGFKPFVKKGSKRLIGMMDFQPEQFKGYIKFYDYLRTYELETVTQSVVEVYCESLDSGYCRIIPKSAFKRMKSLFVSDHPSFQGSAEFFQKYHITDDSEDDTILKKSVADLLMDYQGLTIEVEGNYLLLYYKNKEIKVHEIMGHVELAEELVSLICYDDSEDFV